MSFKAWQPDVIVGVDFGMTSTGVAYSAGPEWPRPETIMQWPASPGGTADKVDTAVAYDKRTGRLTSWGFSVDPFNDQLRLEENFKLILDPLYRGNIPGASSPQEARGYYRDYLKCIYQATCEHLSDTTPGWKYRQVLFVFSVPTTWRDPAMIEETKQVIREAGFGSPQMPNHRMEVTLTEAEAAAVYVAKSQYSKGDVFLVCDAGGGTTDVNILKVISADTGKTQLEPLSCVQGKAIGSTLIDFKVERLLEERLRLVRQYIRGEPKVIAHRMMKQGRFEAFKRSFGNPQSDLRVPLQVLTMEPGLDFPQAQIMDSKIYITQEDLRSVFDEQVSSMFGLIDEELRGLQNSQHHSGEKISFLVLSGGLGSSPYVRKEIQGRYQRATPFANVENIEVLKAPKPQLAVVHGLVDAEVQKLRFDNVVYTTVRCRASYGVLVREIYDPKRHVGEDVRMDPRDGKSWAENQINWFIKQGEAVSVKNGIARPFKRKLNRGQEKMPWSTQILMSTYPPNQLPRSLKRQGAKAVCAVESVINEKDMKLKNRHWYNRKPQYFRAEFSVKVLIGPASLKFEVVGKDGVISATHDDIKVEWMMSTSEGDDAKQNVNEVSYGLEER